MLMWLIQTRLPTPNVTKIPALSWIPGCPFSKRLGIPQTQWITSPTCRTFLMKTLKQKKIQNTNQFKKALPHPTTESTNNPNRPKKISDKTKQILTGQIFYEKFLTFETKTYIFLPMNRPNILTSLLAYCTKKTSSHSNCGTPQRTLENRLDIVLNAR